jgi:RHS repeat-associated protein
MTDTVDPFGRALHSGYDPAGNRLSLTYPDGNRARYSYLDNNWLKTLEAPGGYTTTYERDHVGNLLHITNPNDTVTDITYDKVNRTDTLVTRQTVGAQATINAFDYTYNQVGHVTDVVNTYGWRQPDVVTEHYAYDGLHRLSGMSNSEGVAMGYVYDKAGNRTEWTTNDDLTSQTPFDGFTATYDYNAANQLTGTEVKAEHRVNDESHTFAYDANGNRVNHQWDGPPGTPTQGVDYAFDSENRLVAAQDYQGNGNNRIDRALTTLEYDGGGRRLAQTYDPKIDPQGDKRTEYVFDGLDPVAEYDLLNGQRDNFYRGDMGRIALMHHFPAGTEGQMYWYNYNFKGDVAGLTKQSGQSTHNYRYDPYGGVLPDTGNFTDPHNHYTLTGKEYDENTGLVYFGARYYDATTATWITQDTFRGTRTTPKTLHRYGYVVGNPITYYDPYGYSMDWLVKAANFVVEHKNEFALGAAVVAAGAATVITGGLAAPLLVGALAAGSTTLAINVGSGQDLMADVVENTIGGAMIGFSIGLGGGYLSQLAKFAPMALSNPLLYAQFATQAGALSLMAGGASLMFNPSRGVSDFIRNIGQGMFGVGLGLQTISDSIGLCRSISRDWKPMPNDKRYEQKIVSYPNGNITKMTRPIGQEVNPQYPDYPHFTEQYTPSKTYFDGNPMYDSHYSTGPKNLGTHTPTHLNSGALLDDLGITLPPLQK